MNTRHLLNGRRVEYANYVIPGDDDGLLRGLSVFETLRSHSGRLFRADEHLVRLRDSAHALSVPCPPEAEIKAELIAGIEGYSGDAKVRITLTHGGQRLIMVEPLDTDYIGKPLRVATCQWEPPSWLDGKSKHCSRALSQAARHHTQADEVFWVDSNGDFTEATRSNIFGVIDGVIVTPPNDHRILSGVTRNALLEVAHKNKMPTRETAFGPDDPIDELYASSTLKDLSPVIELNGKEGPGGGPIGTTLSTLYRELVAAECSP